MKKLLTVSGIIVLNAAVSQAALADSHNWPHWYVGLSGGVTFLKDADLRGGADGELTFKDGALATVALGYVPGVTMQPFSNMRLEAEFGYHHNTLDSAILSGTPTTVAQSMRTLSYMGNLYYDFRNSSGWTPYIGGGAGVGTVNLSKRSGIGNTTESDNVFAYQFMAGLSYAPKSMPRTEWSLGYRYFATQSPEFNSASGKIKLDDLKSHDVEVGAKFRF